MDPTVSILIPSYNAGSWLAQTIESAAAQTWIHKEIIVIDDGSLDNSREIARSYARQGVTLLEQPHAGQSAALNAGIRAARGQFYEFLDADDLLAPDKIARQIERLSELPHGWIATGAWARFHRDPVEAAFTDGPVSRDLSPPDWVVSLWTSDSMMHGAAWLVPADLVRQTGGWNERLSLINDFEFFSRLVLASPGVAHCPKARSYYRSGLEGSLSGRRTTAAWQSAYESVRLGTEHLLARENTERTRAACANVWRNLAFDSYVDSPELSRRAGQRVKAFGGKLGRPAGGPSFRLASRCLGWRLARRLQACLLRRRATAP